MKHWQHRPPQAPPGKTAPETAAPEKAAPGAPKPGGSRTAGGFARLRRMAGRPWFFAALCYAACLLGWLVMSLVGLGRDTAAKMSGRLAPFSLQTAECELVNAVLETDGEPGAAGGERIRTLTDDPQLIWRNPDGRTLRTLRFSARYADSPREMCLYYTSAPEEPFSQDKRVFAVQSDDGESYLYTMPQGRIAALRLDPCSNRDNEIAVSGIQCNESASLASYFAPGWFGAFRMALWPGLAAAALELIRQLWALRGKGKGRGRGRRRQPATPDAAT